MTREAGKMIYVDLDEEVYIDPELNARETSVKSDDIEELAASIQQTGGLLQPIGIVPTSPDRKTEHGKPYELSYGYSRCAAFELLHEQNSEYGWKKSVPAMVHEVDESRRLVDQLIENLYRKNMNPMEVALQFKRVLANDPEMSQKRLAQMIGYSDVVVSQYLSVTNLCDEVQSLVLAEKLSYSAAREIASIDLPKDQQITVAELGCNLPFGEFVSQLKETYKKGDGETSGGDTTTADATTAGGTSSGQKSLAEGIRTKVIKEKYLPKFQALLAETKNAKEKQEMEIRIDTARFFLKENGTDIGTKLAPWEEELIKDQKSKEEKEERDRLRKKFIRSSVVMVNKIISEEPPPEAEVRTKKNVQQALAEIQNTVKSELKKGAEQDPPLPTGTMPAGFIVDDVDKLMQEIHQAWKDAEASKAEKKKEAVKKKEEEKKKAEAEAEEAAKGEAVAV